MVVYLKRVIGSDRFEQVLVCEKCGAVFANTPEGRYLARKHVIAEEGSA